MKQAGFPFPITSLCPMIRMTLPMWCQHHALWLIGACPQADQGPAGCHHMTKREVTKDSECWQSSQLTITKGGRPLLIHISLSLNQQWRVAVALSSPQIIPPSPLQSHHSLSDVLQSCLGTRISTELIIKELFNFFFFSKLIFCCFNMLKWLGKGHDKAWQRTAVRERQEQNAQGKGSERGKSFPL